MMQQDNQSDMVASIETPRLLLHRPTQGDVRTLSHLWRNEQVQQFMGGVLSQQDAEARMIGILHQWKESNAGLWAIHEREKGNLIGLCGFGRFASETEIIYKLFPVAWGHGYATEAAAASLEYGFRTLQLDRIIGVTQEANQKSQSVLKKLGMRYRCTVWKWEAAQHVYELNRSVWLTEQKLS
ncbi:acetyltransferase [Ktedonobacteria bacterium brp13]|nr:acetyltransferase [Ktedonobacteria bacterium brp13]